MPVIQPLKRGTLSRLQEAIDQAAAQRGMYTGTISLEHFDAEIALMRAALADVRAQQQSVRRLNEGGAP